MAYQQQQFRTYNGSKIKIINHLKQQRDEGISNNVNLRQTFTSSGSRSCKNVQSPNLLFSKSQLDNILDDKKEIEQRNQSIDNLLPATQLREKSEKIDNISQIVIKTQASENNNHYKLQNEEQKKKKLQELVLKNSQYLNRLEEDDIYAKQSSKVYGKVKGQGPSKDLSTSKVTIYQKDFQKNKINDDVPKITMEFFASFYSKIPDKHETTSINRVDFKPHAPNAQFFTKNQKPLAQYPFAGSSVYKTNFIDWHYNASNKIYPPQEKTTISELPFNNRTMYRDNFNGGQPRFDEDLDFAIKWAKRPNYRLPDFPILSETTNQGTYKTFSTKLNNYKKPEYNVELSPTYYNQYKSTSQKEFINFDKIKSKNDENVQQSEYLLKKKQLVDQFKNNIVESGTQNQK